MGLKYFVVGSCLRGSRGSKRFRRGSVRFRRGLERFRRGSEKFRRGSIFFRGCQKISRGLIFLIFFLEERFVYFFITQR